MSQLAEMRAFVRVVSAGSITSAAEQMGVVKSVVSRRLKELEYRLSAQLLQRTTRRIHVTPAGAQYFDRCVEILAAIDEAEDCLSEETGSLTGTLRIATPLSFGVTHLSSTIREFSTRHPDLYFDIDFSDRQVDLVREGFDVAIRIAKLSDTTLTGRKFATIRHAVCASPAYLQTNGTPTMPEELSGHQGLHYSAATTNAWPYRDPNGKRGSVRLTSAMRTNSGEYLRDAAIAGQGIVMQPLFIVYEAIEQGLLIPLMRNYEWSVMDAWLLYPATRHLPSRTRALVDFVATYYSGKSPWDRCLDATAHIKPT